MSPRQDVVIENRALKQFAQKYGYCLNPAQLAGWIHSEITDRAWQTLETSSELVVQHYHLHYSYRDGRCFISKIDITEESEG